MPDRNTQQKTLQYQRGKKLSPGKCQHSLLLDGRINEHASSAADRAISNNNIKSTGYWSVTFEAA